MKVDLNVLFLTYGKFSYDVTSAILVCQNNETAATLVSQPPVQTSSVEVEPVSFVLINCHSCWPRERKGFVTLYPSKPNTYTVLATQGCKLRKLGQNSSSKIACSSRWDSGVRYCPHDLIACNRLTPKQFNSFVWHNINESCTLNWPMELHMLRTYIRRQPPLGRGGDWLRQRKE